MNVLSNPPLQLTLIGLPIASNSFARFSTTSANDRLKFYDFGIGLLELSTFK